MKNKSYAVFGLGRFGKSVAMELAKNGAEVLAVDSDAEKVKMIAEYVTYAVVADVCDMEAMEALGLGNFDGAIIAITHDLNASVLATILAKEMGVSNVVVKAKDEIHTKVLKKVGADKIIIPEKESGIRMAHSIMAGKLLDFVELSDRVKLVEIKIRENWVGKSLKELDLRKKHKINIVAVRNEKGEIEVGPDPDKKLEANITMLVTVDRNQLDKLVE